MNEIAIKTLNAKLKDCVDKVVNIEKVFAVSALRIFMNFGFGEDFSYDTALENKTCHDVSSGSNTIANLFILPGAFLDYYPWTWEVRRKTISIFKNFQTIIKRRLDVMTSKGSDNADDCLSVMLNEKMDAKTMQDHVITFLCAGHDTTAFFISYMCYLLAQNQDVQEKLRMEIIAVMKDREIVTADDFAEMKYMAKVMQETLRLYAIIPNILRTATQDVVLKSLNVTIPKGQAVFIPFTIMNRDEDLWEKPNEFNPDRFEDGGADFTSARGGFFPFGYGTRVCIGKTFAQIEACVIMSHLLRKHRLEPEPGFRPTILSGISLTTANGINVILRNI